MPWTLKQYRRVFEEFYAGCEPDLQEAIDQRMTFLLEHGNLARRPVSDSIGDGLFELRANTHRHQVRFLYFFSAGKLIIVVTAFFKTTRKTPRSEIERALRRKRAIEIGEEPSNGVDYLH